MAQTTTPVNACNAVIMLDNASGVLTNISGSSNSVKIDFRTRYHQYNHYDNDAPTRLLLGEDLYIDIAVIYSTTDAEGLALLRDWVTGGISGTDARTVRIYMPDGTLGSDVYQAEVISLGISFDLEASRADPIMVQSRLRSTDGYTVGEVTTSTSTSTTSSSTSTTTTSTSTTSSTSTSTSTSSTLSTSTTTTV